MYLKQGWGKSIGVAILLLLGLCKSIIGHPLTAWAILLDWKSGAIQLQLSFKFSSLLPGLLNNILRSQYIVQYNIIYSKPKKYCTFIYWKVVNNILTIQYWASLLKSLAVFINLKIDCLLDLDFFSFCFQLIIQNPIFLTTKGKF